jgi:hypothetical protein
MAPLSQITAADEAKRPPARAGIILIIAFFSMLPSLMEGYAVMWGAHKGFTGKALRDGLDFWTGGFLLLHRQTATLFSPLAYGHFIAQIFGPHLPIHMWSYPPNYLLLAGLFGWLPPWPAVLSFDVCSLLLLFFLLRFAGQPWKLVLAVCASPVALENLLEGQNAALMTALIGGGLLLLETRPRLGGILIGLATIKPQLGIPLPLFLLRSRSVFLSAALAALTLGLASLIASGPGAWTAFWHVTRPAMNNVLLTGQPPAFAGGLISVFATFRFAGVDAAILLQAMVSAACVLLAAKDQKPAILLILCALASPYLHDYDLLGVALAVALLVRDRLRQGFAAGEPLLFFLAWAGPGTLPWLPGLAHFTPLILLLLLATSMRRDRVPACDSRTIPPFLPESSAGP